MKKITTLFISIIFFINNLPAQLEVKDTLLLAFNNEVFWSSSTQLEDNNYSEEYDMTGYTDFGKYGTINLGDDDPTTCWAEGSDGDGTGEYILMTVPENITSLKIRNGYQKSQSIYYSNNRPKNIEFTLYASYEPSGYVTESHNGFFVSEPLATTQAVLEDKLGFQEIKTGFNWDNINEELSHDNTFDKDRFILKIKIVDVYKGNKWNDACISDINIVPEPLYELTSDEHGFVKRIEQNTDTLFYNPDNVYQVIEVSPDLNWAIFIIMPSDIENSRVETIYKLYSIKKEEFIDIRDVYNMYGFITEEGKLYLQGSDNDFNDFSICLDDL